MSIASIRTVSIWEYDDADYPYCSDCFEKRESASIHNCSYKPTPIFYGEGSRYFSVELEIDGGGKDCEKADEILDVGNPFDEQIYICDKATRLVYVPTIVN